MWRVRFKDDRWLYVVLLLEFQSAVDRSMAVRTLTYTRLLYQKLIADGVLRGHGGLPPVLPVVIYNGRRPWTAPVDVSALIASGGGAALARYQPSQRYFLLDEGRVGGSDLPSGNLVSALIALETNRDRVRAAALLEALIELLRKQDDDELTAAFTEWATQVLLPRRFRGSVSGPLPRLEEVRAMLAETVQEWTAEWVEQGPGKKAGGTESSRAASRASVRCCAVRPPGSSTPPRRSGWPPRLSMLRTRTAWSRSATGSLSATRRPICSVVCRTGRRSSPWQCAAKASFLQRVRIPPGN